MAPTSYEIAKPSLLRLTKWFPTETSFFGYMQHIQYIKHFK